MKPYTKNDIPVTPNQKLSALRRIQSMLDHTKHPTARSCGLTEAELRSLAIEQLIVVFFVADEGPDLDRYRVEQIAEGGFSILAQADNSDAELVRASIQAQKLGSATSLIFPAMLKGLWDLTKIALTSLGTIVVTWFLWKKGWK